MATHFQNPKVQTQRSKSIMALPMSANHNRNSFKSIKTLQSRSRAQIRVSMEVGALDSNGRRFKNADEMWREQAGDSSKKTQWYRHGVGCWEKKKGVEASVNGVLGGYGHVNEADINDSEAFINTLLSGCCPKASATSNQRHLVALEIIDRSTKKKNQSPVSGMEIIRDVVDRGMNFERLAEKEQRLKRKLKDLENREDDIKKELEYAEQSRLKRRKVAENWLTNVANLKSRYQKVDKDIQETRLYDPKLRNTIDGLIVEVIELIQQSRFPEGLTLKVN